MLSLANLRIEWHLLVPTFILLSIGIVMISSASIGVTQSLNLPVLYFVKHHVVHLMLGLMMMAFGYLFNVSVLHRRSGMVLGLAIILLAVVLVPGLNKPINGSYRWINLFLFKLQVSELVKLLFIFYLASYLTRHADQVTDDLVGVLKPLSILSMLSGLLLLEPDLGSCVVLAVISFGLLFVGMMPVRYVLLLMSLTASVFYVLIQIAPYRLARLMSFQNPWDFAMHHGYQLTHSLMAIGNGGIFGVGLGESLQRHSYLPEAHTDFIFSILCEELGWLGAALLLGTYMWLFARMWRIAKDCFLQDKPFRGYIVLGIAFWLSSQVIINLGVCLGVLPTKGMTLPLISYGGSSLLMSLLGIGLVCGIANEVRQ